MTGKKRRKERPEDVFLGIIVGSLVFVGLVAIPVLAPSAKRRK